MNSTVMFLLRRAALRRRFCPALSWCFLVLILFPAANAYAGLVGYYVFGNFVPANNGNPNPFSCDGTYGNFTLSETGGLAPNGCVTSPDSNTLILTGTNDGSGAAGSTIFTIPSEGSGLFQFNYLFQTPNPATFDTAGYLRNGAYTQLADTDGQSGAFSVSVLAGQIIGFQVNAYDNTGGPAILTITGFNAPGAVPEPGSFTMIIAGAVLLAGIRLLRSIRARRVAGALAAALVAAVVTAPASAQQVFYSGKIVTGQFSSIGVVNLLQQAQTPNFAKTLQLQGAERLRPAPFLRASIGANRLFGAATVPAPTPGLSVVPATGFFGFNALSHLDQRNADNGNQFSVEPPNQSIAVGGSYVLEGVNDAVQVYNISGTPVLPVVITANQLFGVGLAINWNPPPPATGPVYGVYLTDMRVFYDQYISRFFVVMRSQDEDTSGNYLNQSHLYVAVSQTADPTGSYNIYKMDTTNGSHPGCPCIADYPQIGADQYGFHIAWNEFNTGTLAYLDAAILSISKSDLAAGVASPRAFQFLLSNADDFVMSVQPASAPPGAANFIGNGGVEYFASTSSSFTQNSQIAVWAMSNTSSLSTPTPNPSLTRIVIPSVSYTPPIVASQPAGVAPLGASLGAPTEFLDGGDCRVQALVYAGGQLYLTFPTELVDPNGQFVVGGAYVVLSPTYRFGVLAATVTNQGHFLVTGNHLLRPAIAVNPLGKGSIAVTLVGSAGPYYPSAAFIPFQASSTPSTVQIAAPGTGPEDGFTGYSALGGDGVARWGDYNTAVANSDGSIWMVVQYIGNYPRTTYANWNTYIIRKQP
jgi:hypothetical protein